jgi:hypothetical protein
MKKITTAILIIAATVGSVSCKKDIVGEGPVTAQIRPIQNFTAIDLQMNGNVYFSIDSAPKLEIVAKESIHSILQTTVINNTLVARYSNGKTYDADETIRINVSAPEVNRFELNSSGSIICLSDIHPASPWLRSNGSGSISLQSVVTNSIDAESKASGQITASGGTATSEKLKTDASGKIDLRGITAKRVSAKTIGSGAIKVKVTDHLDAIINGSGSVYYLGHPSLTTYVSGSGHVIRL